MRFFFFLFLLISSYSIQAQSAAEVYIARYDSLAIEVLNNYGIPASIILGIALVESAAGTSKLCRINHNHFGVKGRVKSKKTKSGYTSSYRSFDSDEDAYLYIGKLISSRKYYPALKGNMDYMKWLKAIKASGYARSSSWIPHIDMMIKRYNLVRFDKIAPFPFLPEPDPSGIIIKQE